jgi:voltage-gated potassium channel
MNKIRKYFASQIEEEAHGKSVFGKVVAALITLSILLAIILTEEKYEIHWARALRILDTSVGVAFLIEYAIRVWVAPIQKGYANGARGAIQYMRSPIAVLDLVALMPLLVGAIGSEFFLLRIARLLRISRASRSTRFKKSIEHFNYAISSKWQELQVAIVYTGILLLSSSTLMYLVEGSIQPEPFGSIPRCIWWSVSTISTVGYGDAIPHTIPGKFVAGITALLGIGVVAIPTGILAAGFSESISKSKKNHNSKGSEAESED